MSDAWLQTLAMAAGLIALHGLALRSLCGPRLGRRFTATALLATLALVVLATTCLLAADLSWLRPPPCH